MSYIQERAEAEEQALAQQLFDIFSILTDAISDTCQPIERSRAIVTLTEMYIHLADIMSGVVRNGMDLDKVEEFFCEIPRAFEIDDVWNLFLGRNIFDAVRKQISEN